MKQLALALFVIATAVQACAEKPVEEVYEAPVLNPSRIRFEQTPYTTIVKMTWKDNSDKETGFTLWKKVDDTPEVVAALDPDDTVYVFNEGVLEAGRTYSIGVRAESDNPTLRSQIVYGECSVFDYASLPHGEFIDYNLTTTTSVSLKYKIVNKDGATVDAFGLCWSSEHEPMIDDCHAHGPKASQTAVKTQTISSCDLKYGVKYKVRAYVETEKGIGYGESVEIQLGEEPTGYSLDWVKQDAGLPDGIELYKTTSPIEGRPFTGWYAIADPTKADVRVNLPDGRQTLEQQYTADNYVMINGGYFNMSDGAISDYCCVKGTETRATWCELYYGVFGVDSDGTPFTGWTSKDASQRTWFYDRPATVWYGVSDYGVCTDTYPHTPSDWIPYYAIAAGPLLVQNSNVLVDKTKDESSSQYITNYERRADDIYSPGTTNPPDRTAVGCTADGKVVLFVCDGRTATSSGASIIELARIMKGIGCTGALNLDGGGSTAMLVNGTRINDSTGGNRAVRTTIGFYKK